jgi:hypothetical protein
LIDKSFPSGEIKSNTESIAEVCAVGKRPRQDSTQVSHKRTRVDTDTPATFESIEAVGYPEHRVSVPPIPRSRRKRTPNLRLRDYVVSINGVMTSTKVIPIPRSLKDAKRGPYAKQWDAAVQVEYQALVANNTWKIVPLPKGRKVLGCHWVFDVKYHPDGTIDRFKARLVVRGNTQIQGVDFTEIFSPVAR